MPAELDRCVNRLMRKGKTKDEAYQICVETTGWKKKKGGGWTKKRRKGK